MTNAEATNDRAKLLMHRIIARELRQDPTLIAEAREIIARERLAGLTNSYLDEWEAILALPVHETCRRIVQRDPDMYRLRISSPFGAAPSLSRLGLRDVEVRKRIWRKALLYK